MGYDAYAKTIIGVALLRKEISQTRTVRGCDCPVKDLSTKFCPECGKTMYEKQTGPLPDFDIEEGNFHEFDIITPSSEDKREIFVGKLLNSGYDSGKRSAYQLRPGEYEDIYRDLKAYLEPLGFWNQNHFAIWTVLHESC